MGLLDRARTRVRYGLRRSRRKDDIGEELETWIALAAEEKQAAGMNRAAAEREARLELGGMEVVKEQVYDASIGASLETLVRDVRYALRNLRSQPGFAFTIVLTVALAIAANSSIFTLINTLLLTPAAAIHAPDRLVEVTGGEGNSYVDLSYPALMHLRKNSRALDDLAALAPARMAIDDGAGPEVVMGFQVTGNYLDVLGLHPAIGRFFTPDESFHPQAASAVVISHALWQRRYEGDPAVLGQTLRINGSAFEIVGVGPEGFSGQIAALINDIWLPLGAQGSNFFDAATLDDPNSNPLAGIARLAPDFGAGQAQTELTLLAQAFADEQTSGRVTPIRVEAFSPLPGMVLKPSKFFFGAMMVIVGLVLAIACVNVANMLLSRGADRSKEIAIRLAMGAGRSRVVRQLLIETLVLFGFAAAGGLLISVWATRLLLRVMPELPIPVALDLSPDLRVLGFTAAIATIAGLVCGLVPALQSTRPDLVAALKGERLAGSPSGARGRRFLVATQVTATIVLLICSGLFVRALHAAHRLDLGFDPRDVHVAQLDFELTGLEPQSIRELHRRLFESLRAIPGVRTVALSHKLPLASKSGMGGIQVEGVTAPSQYGFTVGHLLVEGPYHEAVGIPLVEGRFIRDTDGPDAPRVAVINQRMADRMWPDGNAVGRTFWSGPVGTSIPYEVIGVAADANYHGLVEDTPNFAYMPHGQHAKPPSASWGPTNLLIRTAPGQELSLAAIQSRVAALDPSIPVLSVRRLSTHISRYWFPQRLAAWITGVVGSIGLLLGAIGIYGVTAYAVSQRRTEISIRMALGARARDVVRTVVSGGMVAPTIGMVVGMGVAFGLTRVLDRLLVDVSPLDPLTFGGVALILGLVAFTANWLPARRAARVNPASTLKQ